MYVQKAVKMLPDSAHLNSWSVNLSVSFTCETMHMRACVCLFVCVYGSVKGSRMAYEARCVSTGDMWLGERAPSKSLF